MHILKDCIFFPLNDLPNKKQIKGIHYEKRGFCCWFLKICIINVGNVLPNFFLTKCHASEIKPA